MENILQKIIPFNYEGRPITVMSRILAENEEYYGTNERELLAIA